MEPKVGLADDALAATRILDGNPIPPESRA
jgi:hypothetical protein